MNFNLPNPIKLADYGRCVSKKFSTQWNLYKQTLSTADNSHNRKIQNFPYELKFFVIRSTFPRADTSGERTADNLFIQKGTCITGKNEK